MAMFTAAIVAVLAFRTPWDTLAVASAKGVWDAIFILYVIWPALLLYQITKRAGAYDALRQGIAKFSRNDLFIILALSWVFRVVPAGHRRLRRPGRRGGATADHGGREADPCGRHGRPRPRLGRFFGTLGVGWLALLRVSNIEDVVRAAYESALLILIPTYLGGLLVVVALRPRASGAPCPGRWY